MRKKLQTGAAVAAFALALFAPGGTGAAEPVKTVVGNVETELGGGFSPRALAEKKPTPIAASLWWKVRTLEKIQPPALKTLRIKGDRHTEFDLKGRPVCKLPASGPRLSVADVRKRCGAAIVGLGRIEVGVAFVGDMTIDVESELLVINRGVESKITNLYAYAFLPAPAGAALVIPIEVKRIRRGRFGTESIASIPKIAGGGGSVTYFKLDFKNGVLRGACPDGQLKARITAFFMDGTRVPAAVARPCRI